MVREFPATSWFSATLYVNTLDDYFAVIVAREEMTDGARGERKEE